MNRAEQIAAVTASIESMLNAWEQGRMTSPDQSDYVAAGYEVLGWEIDDTELNRIAEVIYEDAGETYTEVSDIALFIVEQLVGKRITLHDLSTGRLVAMEGSTLYDVTVTSDDGQTASARIAADGPRAAQTRLMAIQTTMRLSGQTVEYVTAEVTE